MAKLLYIESSPRKERSASIAVSKTFLEAYRKENPQDEIVTIDLWNKSLPEFNGNVIDSKYAIIHGKTFTKEQKASWKAVENLIAEFKDADKYVISLPMWNYSIPYKLKHYIDLIVQPGYTFAVTPEGEYKGLVSGKPITLIYARGGAYGAKTGASAFDLQKLYMETILKFIGFTKFHSIIIEPTLASPESKEKTLKQGNEEAKKIAASF